MSESKDVLEERDRCYRVVQYSFCDSCISIDDEKELLRGIKMPDWFEDAMKNASGDPVDLDALSYHNPDE